MDDQRDYAEEAANRADLEREGAEELAAERVGRRCREDGVEPAPILDLAVLTRRTKGSTNTRAAKDGA
jgi:hypothetical protein